MNSFWAMVLYAIQCDILHNVRAMFSAGPGVLIFGPVFVSVHNCLQFTPSLWKAHILDMKYFIFYFYCFRVQDQWLKFQPGHMLTFAGAQIRSCTAQLHFFHVHNVCLYLTPLFFVDVVEYF
jgi:hypothetical protein